MFANLKGVNDHLHLKGRKAVVVTTDNKFLDKIKKWNKDAMLGIVTAVGPFYFTYNNCLSHNTPIETFQHLLTGDYGSSGTIMTDLDIILARLCDVVYTDQKSKDYSFDELFKSQIDALERTAKNTLLPDKEREQASFAKEYLDVDMRNKTGAIRLVSLHKFYPFNGLTRYLGTPVDLATYVADGYAAVTGGESYSSATCKFCKFSVTFNGEIKTILAFKGTSTILDYRVDSCIGLTGGYASYINETIDDIIINKLGGEYPDIICGHSLGAIFALACRHLAKWRIVALCSPMMFPEEALKPNYTAKVAMYNNLKDKVMEYAKASHEAAEPIRKNDMGSTIA